jgi:ParB-like chromosome segregation protein Spo0J
MNTQTISIDKIKPNPDNPRTISDEKLQQLVNSIQVFPEMLNIRPIVIDENRVALGGNMRIKACKLAGIREVSVVFADKLSDQQKKNSSPLIATLPLSAIGVSIAIATLPLCP